MAALASGVVSFRIPSASLNASSDSVSVHQRVVKPVGRFPLLVKSSLRNDTNLLRHGVKKAVNTLKILRQVRGDAGLVKDEHVCPCGASLEPIKRERDYSSTSAVRKLLLTSPALLLASISNSVFAEEAIVDSDALPLDSTDGVVNVAVSVLLTASFVGLLVLTSGIIYLGFTEWRDKRQLESESKSIFPPTPEEEVRKPRKTRVSPRGFGGGSKKDK